MNSSLMLRNAVNAGLGLGEIPVPLREREELVRVWPERKRSAPHEVWLVTHDDLRHTASVRAMMDAAIEVFDAVR